MLLYQEGGTVKKDGKVKWWLHNEVRVGAERCMEDMTD